MAQNRPDLVGQVIRSTDPTLANLRIEKAVDITEDCPHTQAPACEKFLLEYAPVDTRTVVILMDGSSGHQKSVYGYWFLDELNKLSEEQLLRLEVNAKWLGLTPAELRHLLRENVLVPDTVLV